MNRFFTFLILINLAACAPRIHYIDTSAEYIKAEEAANDTDIAEMIAPYKERLDAEMNTVIGNTTKELVKAKPESPMGNWLADLIHKKSEDYYRSKIDFALVNYGGIRIPVLAEGEVTRGKIFELMPFDNMLVVLEINGATVRQIFGTMAANGGWPISKQVSYVIENELPVDILINGEALDDGKIYKVALSDYLANGGDNLFFLKDKKQHNLSVLFRDAMSEYIVEQNGEAMDAEVEGRVTTRKSNLMNKVEEILYMSCPVQEGPQAVISYLENKPDYIRNKQFDKGNGSVRFNAKNARFEGYELVDEKSVFLLNYHIQKDEFSLFQAIYFFKNEEDKNIVYSKIAEFLKNEASFNHDLKSDIRGKSYDRYYLPDGSGFNLKRYNSGK